MSTGRALRRRVVIRAAIGLGAAAGLGALAGCGDAPDGVTLSEGVLDTRYGTDSSRWRLAVPADGRARGLVVALHGAGGDADNAFSLGYADAVASTGLALASVDGRRTYWHKRTDGSDTGAMVRDELVPLALERSGLAPTSRVGLLGWSMGGFGALLIASDLGPRRVTGVVAASAALWLRGSQTPARAYDGAADFDRHSIFNRVDRLADVPVRLDCGLSDPFIAANRTLAGRRRHVSAAGAQQRRSAAALVSAAPAPWDVPAPRVRPGRRSPRRWRAPSGPCRRGGSR